MNAVKIAASGFAAGAAWMYFTDPDRGKRRRALTRDRSVRAWNSFNHLVDKAQRDTMNRARGAASAIRAAFQDHHTDDVILVERVRSRLGRLVSHPHSIDVTVQNGKITLKGLVLEDELSGLLSAVRAVPGVTHLENKLEAYNSSEHIPGLQGGIRRQDHSEFTQQNWTPALRIAAGAVGCALVPYSLRRNGAVAAAGGLIGAALLGRAVWNKELRDMVGMGDGAKAVEFEKAIHIQAPPEEVFKFWSDCGMLPRFMTHLKEVRDLGQGRSHWVVDGPAGIPVSWDAEVTNCIPNKLLAWRSLPGSTVNTEGTVRFDEDGHGGTRLSIRLFYKPPAGVLGHYMASLMGTDPKSEMDDDMVRLKSLIEHGKTRAHGVKVDRESVMSFGRIGTV